MSAFSNKEKLMLQGKDYFYSLCSKNMNFISDSHKALDIAKSLGFYNTFHFEDVNFSTIEPVFLLICHYETHSKLMNMWGNSLSYICHLALCKFDASEKSIRYSIEKILSLDFNDVIENRQRAYHLIETSSDMIEVHSGSNQILVCQTADELEVADQKEFLEEGDVYSISEWLEASIVNLKSDKCSFSLTGEFEFSGLIYLCNNLFLKEKHRQHLKEIVEMTSSAHNLAVFEDNKLIEIMANGQSILGHFKELSQEEPRGLSAVEFAFGCAKHKIQPDFSINSLVNESTYGVHVGLGMAKAMPHIDLISQNAQSFFINNQTHVKQVLS